MFIFVSTIFCKYERNPNSTTNAIRICPIRMCVIGTDKPVDCNKIKLSANVLKLYIPIIRIIKGKIKASNRRSITFRLIENFKPASWTFLYLKTSIQMIAAINGARSVTSNIKCLTPIIDWKSLSIMDNAIVMTKKTKIVIAH
ncbi:hypothetical protein SACIG1750_0174 [Staphylococcus aureus subsp. aureus CIG1750]|nr:hypothetical protein SACIG1750_0174 [Staphylococcus aureus subsp. aureus CIG1750]